MTLRINKLSFSIGQNEILRSVNAIIEQGELVGLIGANGAGKTTLVNILTGFLPPSNGDASLDGHTITGRGPQWPAQRGIARTFQRQHLPWNLTVQECLKAAREACHYWPNHSPAKHRAQHNSRNHENDEYLQQKLGLADSSNKPARDLSYGQQRLLLLSMAVVSPSKVLLLDEPFTGVRSTALENIIAVLREEAKMKAVLIIDHALSAVCSIATKILFMNHGTIRSFSDFGSLLESKEFRTNYMGSPAVISTSEPKKVKQEKSGAKTLFAHKPVLPPKTVLNLRGVSIGYGNVPVLSRIDLQIGAGQILGVIGLNGSGKSTLLRGIAGLVSLIEGDIEFLGQDIHGLQPNEIAAKGIRLLVQDHCLFRTLSMEENLVLSAVSLTRRQESGIPMLLRYETMNLISEHKTALKDQGIRFRNATADTYSGGEQARLALSALSFGDPALILLDEPTAGLDGAAINELRAMVREWAALGVAVIIVEHSLNFVVGLCNNIVVVQHGSLRELDQTKAVSPDFLLREMVAVDREYRDNSDSAVE